MQCRVEACNHMGSVFIGIEDQSFVAKDGDRNTNFFHSVIKERRRKNTISLQQPDGEVIHNLEQIGGLAATYFAQLFSASQYVTP